MDELLQIVEEIGETYGAESPGATSGDLSDWASRIRAFWTPETAAFFGAASNYAALMRADLRNTHKPIAMQRSIDAARGRFYDTYDAMVETKSHQTKPACGPEPKAES